MSNATRRFARLLILVLVATGFSACHFHGHHGFHGHWGHYHAPVRHCR
ncbi:MAG TPA: hypothetical protein VF384_03940 [Planctomycetota bacterium]